MAIYSKILSTGSYVPSRVVTNKELSEKFNTSDKWITEKIGIKERRFAAPGEGVSDLALKAAVKALEKGNIGPQEIDAIIFATSTSDFHAPGSGVILQNKLGCKQIPAFDVRNTSPGFIYSLELADSLIQSQKYQKVLVVGAEVHSTGLDFSDNGRLMSVIFGDGAGCFLLERSDSPGILTTKLHSNGKHFDKLWCEGPSSLRNPRVSKEQIDQGIFYPKMDGRFVFQNAVELMSNSLLEVCTLNKTALSQIHHFVLHQANKRILQNIQEKLNLPSEKFHANIQKYGNTSSASIPILFDELIENKTIKKDELIALASFGSGFCWGSVLLNY